MTELTTALIIAALLALAFWLASLLSRGGSR